MDNEIKLKNIQIALFFKNEVDFNALELANDITKKIPQLGQPNIFNLPEDIPNEIRVETPKIIFNNARELKATISILNMSLNIIGENISSEIKNLINLLYDSLITQNIQIKSIGLVSEYVCYDVNFDIIKNNYYKDELVCSEIVNSSWYNKDNNLNVWKFLNVQEENNVKTLNIKCDVNNRGNQDVINKEIIDEIIDKSKEISEKFKEKIKQKLGE